MAVYTFYQQPKSVKLHMGIGLAMEYLFYIHHQVSSHAEQLDAANLMVRISYCYLECIIITGS